jgi:NADPH:quinone reductase-like Zn-dependent oxidoreductase
MADTMKALILEGDGYAGKPPDNATLAAMEPFVHLGNLPVPEPREGQVRIKVALASVNPSDEMFIQGLYGQPRIKGNAAGFEGVGEVVASGGGPLADGCLGQRVAFVAVASAPGTWSEFSIADAAGCIPLIDGVRDEDGAAMIVNPLTALAMFGIVKQDEAKAFIVSAGASQLSKLIIGAAADEDYRPIAIVRRDSQIEPLKTLGAAHVLNSESGDFEQQLTAVLREEKPRVFLDAVANQLSARVFAAMGRHARWVIYGKLDAELPTLLEPGHFIFMGKRIEGFWLVRWMKEAPMADKKAAIENAQRRFAGGEWTTDVTAILSLEEAMTGLPAELSKPNGKVFIKP